MHTVGTEHECSLPPVALSAAALTSTGLYKPFALLSRTVVGVGPQLAFDLLQFDDQVGGRQWMLHPHCRLCQP